MPDLDECLLKYECLWAAPPHEPHQDDHNAEVQEDQPSSRSTVHGPNPEGADSRPKKFKIGPYTVVDTVDHVLGGGSYGKVFCSTGKDGRKAVVKLFRKRDAMDDAKHEADMYRRISPLASAYQRWFPQMLDANVHGTYWSTICSLSLRSQLGEMARSPGRQRGLWSCWKQFKTYGAKLDGLKWPSFVQHHYLSDRMVFLCFFPHLFCVGSSPFGK